MDYYTTVEKEASTGHVTTQMSLANRMLSESSRTQGPIGVIPSGAESRTGQSTGMEQLSGCQGRRAGGTGEWVLTGTGLPSRGERVVWCQD